ncbi:helix-turn-helix domain-containing protein [Amycolatopsis sp. 3B14]|uniref:helix-turn-helix domain-containing protein n=1 Tax=Amycolatopsis sp. 3B14 TaxID=3243600 RepID=UPI003D99F41A
MSDDHAAAIVGRLLEAREGFIAELIGEMRARIPELDHDAAIVRLLEASVSENVVGGVNSLIHDEDAGSIDAPDSALAYARALARNGVPLSALIRAYRVGHSRFIDLVFRFGARIPDEVRADVLALLVRRSTFWLDEVTSQVARAYEVEREAWLSGSQGLRRRVVTDLLEHRPITADQAERVLGYGFDGIHRCVLIQTAAPRAADTVVEVLRLALRARAHLAVELGDGVTALWLTVSDTAESRITADVEPAALVAIGAAAHGVDGFRRSYRQAERVRVVLTSGDGKPPAGIDGRSGWARFSEMTPVALMVHDVEELRAFVRRQLGDLARPDARIEVLRQTLWTYLCARSSVSAAAATLTMHRNSVQYRVERAVELLPGQTLPEPTYDLQVALHAAGWLGAAVLD